MLAATVNGPTAGQVRQQVVRRARLRAALLYWLVIPAAVIGSGKGVDQVLGSWQAGPLTLLAGGTLVLAGCALVHKATGDLRRHGEGSPAPQAPARFLVTAGSYAWCRHPMFLGYDLAAWGTGLLLASPGMLLGSLPVMLLWQLRVLRREEAVLAKRFADCWPEYQRQVPLLLPRLPRKRVPS